MTEQPLSKRLTIRANEVDVERLNQISAKSGVSVSDLIRAGINIALLNEEVFQHYEARQDLLLEGFSQKLELLVDDFEKRMTSLLSTTDKLADGIRDMLEADRSIIEYFKEALADHVKQLNGTSGFRSTSGGSTSRVGPTGAPILG